MMKDTMPQYGSTGGNTMKQIHEGMKVYDSDDKEIGKVDYVQMSDESTRASELGTGPATIEQTTALTDELLRDVARVFDEDNVPQELRRRLEHNGFIRVKAAGLLARDRYVMPEQIASVSGDRVKLKVSRDQLIKQ